MSKIWRQPLQLALLTAIGLLTALLGSGPWRVLAWSCLSVPLMTGLRYAWVWCRKEESN